jgi:hypothetical protein
MATNCERFQKQLKSGDAIALIWTIHDVIDATRDEDDRPTLTRDQARDVLADVYQKHDASVGVTWDTLSWYAPETRMAIEGSEPYSYPWEEVE